MHSLNKVDENIQKIAAQFPNCITERKNKNGEVKCVIDFDMLKQELSEVIVEGNEERYQFTWPDKKKSILLANSPIAKTLRPCHEESVDFDHTENLYIEGDNLEVLKLLQETYLGKVKMIYIDPPYNTGNDFVYEDDFAQSTAEYFENSGQFDDEGNRLVKNMETNGRFHTDWLNMIYPRLKLAKDLLTDDGVIFINMDEHEITNLQKICNEIYGENNDLGVIIWDKRNPKGDVCGVAYQHEYILTYAKNKMVFSEKSTMQRPKKNALLMLQKAAFYYNKINDNYKFEDANKDYSKWISVQKDLTGGEKAYNCLDEFGNVYQPVSMAAPDKPETRSHRPLIHPFTGKPCPVPAKGWRFTDKSMDELIKSNEIIFGKDETVQPRRKYLLKDNINENISSLLYYGGSDSNILASITVPFDTPKVVNIVKEHIQSIVNKNDIILDFFSGSATTAHAVMQLNAEDGGNRKFIMVQLPEQTDEKSEAFKAGYKNICEIGKERIRRAGNKIAQDNPQAKFDKGFRVLKCDSSNMKESYYNPAEYSLDLLDSLIDNIKSDRTPEDLLFQIMLDLGVLLSSKIEQTTIAGKKVFNVADNFLMACFDENISDDVITAIAKQKPYYFVMRDNSIANDNVATNFEQIFKTYSPETKKKVL